MSGTSGTLTAFTAGDLVISISGDGNDSGSYTDNQASPAVLEELTTTGTIVGTMVLPQQTTVVNGVTENAFSLEYGSSSEGTLQLSADGQSLVIAGYGVNAVTYNTGGATVYGNAALAQSTSILGGKYTAVPRVIADISYNGVIDTSTALYGVFNTNNPRSVATVNGTTFWISGQGVTGDTTQGVFFTHDGASNATGIDNSSDTRSLQIYDGQLYVSRDSKQVGGGEISTYGTTLPSTATTPTVLPDLGTSVTLTAAQENTVNAGAVGSAVNLSPENFFFASPTVLYVADGGDPKEGGVGDGGLQKWVLTGGTWQLDYTLSLGLNLVNSTSATSGSSGLIGLTGTVVNGGTVVLYATNSTIGDLDQTYLYTITDPLSATSNTGSSFTVLETAAADTNIRGVSFAPQAASVTTSTTSVGSGVTSSGLTITSGSTLTVANGGTVIATTVMSGGSMTVASGGVDSGTDIAQGGSETVSGSVVSGDFVGGTQFISVASAVVTNEVVLNGGTVELFKAGIIANNPTVEAGGTLLISGGITASNAVISGGLIALQSPKATLAGSVTFLNGGTIEITSNTSPTSSGVSYGDQAVVSGFGSGAVIDLSSNTSVGKAGSAATLSTTTSGGDTVATISGGGTSEVFIFAGTTLGSFLSLTSDGNGGEELVYSAPPPVSTTVSGGVSSGGLMVGSGSFVDVLSGGTVTGLTLMAFGSAQIEVGGSDISATVSSGGSELVFGSASGDAIYGTQVLSNSAGASSSTAVVSGETVFAGGTVDLFLKGAVASAVTIMSGGTLAISGNASATNAVLSGGTIVMESGKADLSGGLTFATSGVLELTSFVSSTTSSGDQAVISNFGSGDVVDLTFMGTGATISSVVSGGNTVASVTSNGTVETLIFAGSVTNNLTLTSDGNGGEEIAFTSGTTSSSGGTLTAFTAGDLVISEVGDVANNGTYALDQASPIYLQELTTTGTIVGTMVLPQQTTVVNGVIEYGISGEYGSASEGSLQLAANGQSLVILGYGVSAANFDAANGGTIYGTTALGQTTSIQNGTATAVPRVVADISFNGSIDTSTALYGVFNTNNPRSVATVNGTTFYLAGQGVSGDTTQGVFVAHDGASSATAIDTSTDVRFVAIYNGALYVSRDSTQNKTVGTDIGTYGTTLPTSATAQQVLPGIDESLTLTAAQENSVNASAVGTSVNLSPENFFFASPTVLYVADSGAPKNGGVGDGGLQKWVFNGTSWQLEYTLSLGLNLVNSTSATSGTTGLIGLTGTVVNGGTVELYATTEALTETGQSYLVGITDPLSATSNTGSGFTVLETAPSDVIIRGVSFAPSSASVATSTTSVGSGVTSSGVTITSGSTLVVANGGTSVAATILSGGTMLVSSGGVDAGTDIAQGGSETVSGSVVSGDFVGGTQFISVASAVVTNEVVLNGGTVELFKAGIIANNPTVDAGGTLLISGGITASNAVISGGLVALQSPKATLSGSVLFVGAGTIEVTSNTAATSSGVSYGDQAVVSNFGLGDVIDFSSNTSVGHAGSAATLSTTTSGGNTVATISGGGATETYIFAGTAIGPFLSLTSDGNGGEEVVFSAGTPTSTTISGGVSSGGLAVASGSFVDVLSGGTVTNLTLLTYGSAQIEVGGTDISATVSSGGSELVFGSASGDAIYGTQILSAPTSATSSVAVVSGETVFAGGMIDLFLKGAVANAITVMTGGSVVVSGNAFADNVVLSGGAVVLESGKASISGGLTFATSGLLELTTNIASTSSSGELAVLSNFTSGDTVDLTFMGAGATISSLTSSGNTVAAVTSNGTTQDITFAGTIGNHLTLAADGNGGEEIIFTTSSATSSSTALQVGSGVTSSGLVFSGGSAVEVEAGGTLTAAVVVSGGSATVDVGGIDSASTIGLGGTETVNGSVALDQILGTQFLNGSASSETISSGGSAVVEAGGVDSGSIIGAGGNETVLNSATGDQVSGIQLVSAATAVVTNETVFNGGNVELFLAGAIGNGITAQTGGQITISGRGTLEAGVLSGGSVLLESPKATISGTLTWTSGSVLEETATVSAMSAGIYFGDQAVNIGFGAGDAIAFTAATQVGEAGSAATLNVSTSGGDTIAVITGAGTSNTTQSFTFSGTTIAGALSLVTSGGTVELVACFAAGTRIATARGEVAVEDLRVGEMVPTVLGEAAAPITWIGRREVDCAGHTKPKLVWPVRIAAGAFGQGVPHSDVHLSPDHAVYVNEVLVPVKHLVNGTTIAQVPVERVTYYHIALPAHDVVLAQGLPVESYLEMKDGWNYRDPSGAVVLRPDFVGWMWDALGCAKLVVTGPELAAARAVVARQAGVAAAA